MSGTNQSSGQWLKLHEAANVLGVSEITLRRKIKSGRVPSELRDGKYYVCLDAQHVPETPQRALHLQSPVTNNIAKHTPTMRATRDDSHWEQKINDLETQLQMKNEVIIQLKREFEDQQTLITFLEDQLTEKQKELSKPIQIAVAPASKKEEKIDQSPNVRDTFPYRII